MHQRAMTGFFQSVGQWLTDWLVGRPYTVRLLRRGLSFFRVNESNDELFLDCCRQVSLFGSIF